MAANDGRGRWRWVSRKPRGWLVLNVKDILGLSRKPSDALVLMIGWSRCWNRWWNQLWQQPRGVAERVETTPATMIRVSELTPALASASASALALVVGPSGRQLTLKHLLSRDRAPDGPFACLSHDKSKQMPRRSITG